MFKRSNLNPILKPNPRHDWENIAVFNPTVWYENGQYHLFYRALGRDWISRIGYAISNDGENFKSSKCVLEPTPGDKNETKGLEDPRITKIDNTYYLTHTIYDGITPRQALATSKDLKNWRKHGYILDGWDAKRGGDQNFIRKKYVKNKLRISVDCSKAGAIFPEKIGGKFYMLFGESRIWLAISDDGFRWQTEFKPLITNNKNHRFENDWVEMGPNPIKTKLGWLVIYHGIIRKEKYSLGFVILNANNPKNILFRSPRPIFGPKEPYEVSGLVGILPGGYDRMKEMTKQELKEFIVKARKENTMPKVVFCCGAVVVDGFLKIYYGAGDTVIGMAQTKLNNILKLTKK